MSRGGSIARIAVSATGEVQPSSLTNIPGNIFTSEAGTSIFPSGTCVQMKSILYQSYNSLGLNGSWQNVPNMSIDIAPKTSTSKIKIEVRWFGEVADAWNVVFSITRNGTLINMPFQEGSRNGSLGVPCQSYVSDDNNSTPELSFITTFDTPNTTNLVTYRLVARHDSGTTLLTGKVYDTGVRGTNYEQGSTEMIVTEYLS